MRLRERSRARAALSRLPRWVTALGAAALAVELAGAALLVTGPHRSAGNHGQTRTATPNRVPAQTSTGNHHPAQTATGKHGRTRTVVLRVGGVSLVNDRCTPVPPVPCGLEVGYNTSGTALGALMTPTPRAARLPFTETIHVEAGEIVTLNASSRTDSRLTCSITVDGSVLSQITALTPNGDEASSADCHSMIPDSGTRPAAARRTAVLRVDSVPNAACRPEPRGCFPGVVDYTTPVGDAASFSAAAPFNAKIPVPVGGSVSLEIAAAAEDLATCSITVDGGVLSQDTNHGYLGQAFCRATIP